MPYQPEKNEVFFCGKCNRQQQPSEGIKCKICGKVTVSWYTGKESVKTALQKWKNVNG